MKEIGKDDIEIKEIKTQYFFRLVGLSNENKIEQENQITTITKNFQIILDVYKSKLGKSNENNGPEILEFGVIKNNLFNEIDIVFKNKSIFRKIFLYEASSCSDKNKNIDFNLYEIVIKEENNSIENKYIFLLDPSFSIIEFINDEKKIKINNETPVFLYFQNYFLGGGTDARRIATFENVGENGNFVIQYLLIQENQDAGYKSDNFSEI